MDLESMSSSGSVPAKGRAIDQTTCLSFLRRLLEEPGSSVWAKAILSFVTTNIVISITALVLESDAAMQEGNTFLFKTVEQFTTIVFTVEYVLRFGVAGLLGRSRIKWCLEPLHICDLLAVLPWYIELVWGESTEIEVLRVLRVLQVIKFVRIMVVPSSKNSHDSRFSIQSFFAVMVEAFPALTILVLGMVLLLFLFSASLYYSERFGCTEFYVIEDFIAYVEECTIASTNGGFWTASGHLCCQYRCLSELREASATVAPYCQAPSVPDSTIVAQAVSSNALASVVRTGWLVIATLTTVGYGDVSPQTWLGKLCITLCMLSGILLIALPVAVVSSKVHAAYEKAQMVKVQKFKNQRRPSTLRIAQMPQEGDVAKIVMGQIQDDIMKSIKLKEQLRELSNREKLLRDSIMQNFYALVEVASSNIEPIVLTETSLGLFELMHPFRCFCLKLADSSSFDTFILGVILVNSVSMAFQSGWDDESTFGYTVLQVSDILFIAIFTTECGIKIVAWGMWGHRAYMSDGWNWLDFFVVISGLLSQFVRTLISPSSSKLLRTLRVLRPLRAASRLPGLRALIEAVFQSLPKLASVSIMALFLFFIFSIFGIQFWGGVLYRRCRLTPGPLSFALEPSQCTTEYCFPLSTDSHVDPHTAAIVAHWCPLGSPCHNAVYEGNNYHLWPVDASQTRLCGGLYSCVAPLELSPAIVDALGILAVPLVPKEGAMFPNRTYCGNGIADDGEYGPTRLELGSFALPADTHLSDYKGDVNHVAFNFGWTNFDSLPLAIIVVAQTVTMEGWSDIMYLLQDCYGPIVPALYFVCMVLVGSFFLINVILAIVWDAFKNTSGDVRKEIEISESTNFKLKRARGTHSFEDSMLTDLPERNSCVAITEKVLFHVVTQLFIFFVIMANVVVLASDTHPPPKKEVADALYDANLACTFIFTLEMCAMIFVLGFWKYWLNYLNAFDGIVVLLSLFELVLRDGSSTITSFRLARLLRVFKLAKMLTPLRLLVKSVLTTVLQLGNFFILLGLMMFVFALAGQTLFSGQLVFDSDGSLLQDCQGYANYMANQAFCEDICPKNPCTGMPSCVPRSHFDDIFRSFVTMMQLMTGENWNEVMYYSLKSVGWSAFLFFIVVFAGGNFIVLNLFIAILVGSFDQETRIMQAEDIKRRATRTVDLAQASINLSVINRFTKYQLKKIRPSEITDSKPLASDNPRRKRRLDKIIPASMWDRSLFLWSPNSLLRHRCVLLINHPYFEQFILLLIVVSSATLVVQSPLSNPADFEFLTDYNVVFALLFSVEAAVKIIARGLLFTGVRENATLPYLRSPWNLLDILVVAASWIDLLGSDANLPVVRSARILRALRPLRIISRNENLKLVVNTFLKSLPELCNVMLFGMLLFLIFGLVGVSFFRGSFAYCVDSSLERVDLKNIPCTTSLQATAGELLCLDAANFDIARIPDVCTGSESRFRRGHHETPICVLDCSYADLDGPLAELCAENKPDGSTWGYNVMKCSDCARHFCPSVVDDSCDIQCSMPKDAAHFCWGMSDASPEAQRECVEECVAACRCDSICVGHNKDAARCVEQGGRWQTYDRNFDNIVRAMISLFEIATTEGWVELMFVAIDARGPFLQPITDNHPYASSIFFLFFIVVGNFFLINLCVAIIIDNFNKIKHSSRQNSLLLTPWQQRWMESQISLFSKNHFFLFTDLQLLPYVQRRFVFMVTNKHFDTFIMTCICFNALAMALQFVPAPKGYLQTLSLINVAFTIVFNVEFFLKFFAFRLAYFREGWNIFDFLCVVATDAGVVLDYFFDIGTGMVVTSMRLFRVARLFRIVRFFRGLNQIFTAFFLSLPKLANVAGILALLLMLYALVGVSLFGTTRQVGIHNAHANFHSFPVAVLTLIRSMTGEGWNNLMHDLSRDKYFFESMLNIHCISNMLVTKDNYQELSDQGYITNPIQCGNSLLAHVFFISFTALVGFVILNLFIAVIFEGFEESRDSGERYILDQCMDLWPQFDPNYTMLVPLDDAYRFIGRIVPPEHLPENFELQAISVSSSKTDAISPVRTSFAYYDLNCIRILKLQMSEDRKVHFSSCVLAIMRCIVLSRAKATNGGDMRAALIEIATVERLSQGVALPASGMIRLARLHVRHESLHLSSASMSVEEQIAAAKIQKRFKEAFQYRRRANRDSAQEQTTDEPITRAAG